MARQLKSDLLRLQQEFTKDHDQFRILKASVDELICRFIRKDGKFFDIQANITDSYPSEQPFWVVINGDETVTDLLEEPLATFNSTKGLGNNIINQVVMMVSVLCRIYEEALPQELDRFSDSNSVAEADEDTGNESDEEDEENSDGMDDDEDGAFGSDDESPEDYKMFEMAASGINIATTNPAESELDAKHAEILKRQTNLQYGKQSVGGSARDKVLLKELKTIYLSEMYTKDKIYEIQLVDEALDVWEVNLMSVCAESPLHSDLKRLKEKGLSGSIKMRITFEETFPFAPPFIQVTYPAIIGGHVLDQGALCMELLTTDGWSSVYSMENVLMQISSTLITGNARVDFEKTQIILKRPYNMKEARKMFAYHASLHKKHGWVLPANPNS